MTASPSASSEQNGPISPRLGMATQAVHLPECQGIWSTSSVVYMPQNPLFLAIDVPKEHEMSLIAEPNIIKEFRLPFDLVLGSPSHHSTFCYVSWCDFLLYLDPLWVRMKILDEDSLRWSTWIERPSSRLNLLMYFLGLFLTDSLTPFRLTRVLALSFLPDLGVSAFLLSLFTDPLARN